MAPSRPQQRRDSPTTTMVPISTPTAQRSPIKQRKMGITAQQKQALIDNLQLEITERARRLRAQYNMQAQGLRSRIEIRVNRIPMALRKYKMEDLLLKYSEKEQQRPAAAVPATRHALPSANEPLRSAHSRPAPATRTHQSHRFGRPQKRTSDDFHGDKENEVEHLENPKKKPRGPQGAEAAHVRPGQVLSPTSSNSRLKNGRPVSPAKPQARPGSPLKGTTASRTAAATSMLSNFVEKARLTRATGTRKVTTASNTSSSSGSAPPPAKSTRRAAATPASAATRTPAKTRPATAARTGRRASLTSETSEASNTTVVRKGATSRAGTATSTAKTKATGGYAKPTASGNAKKTPAKPTTTRTGRVLRARG